jgi:hypothetical protein
MIIIYFCYVFFIGKHVKLICPPNGGSTYFNYMKFHSIVLLAICDAYCNFIFVDVGAQGSRSDGGIFKDCAIKRAIVENTLNLPHPEALPNTDIVLPYYFIEDSAFG